MAKNDSLGNARNLKEDEFYTQLSDIEFEMKHYKEHFKDKVVYCNCDDPYESNFFKYFAMNFNQLGIKKLIATCYQGSPFAFTQLSLFGDDLDVASNKKAYKIEINEVLDYNEDGAVDLADVELLLKSKKNILKKLKDNGDFRNDECVELLKQADIVVTNPPFSLFREYVALLMKYDKKFLIIGNQNNVTYKEIFPLIQNDKIWLGYKFGDMAFRVPSHYQPRPTRFWIDETGQRWRSFGTICWYTNLNHQKRQEKLILYKKYYENETYYPKYDNYDVINVNKVAEIPCDYEGVMGVPITFLDKYNPEQFEILGLANSARYIGNFPCYTVIEGRKIYNRILIRRRTSHEN